MEIYNNSSQYFGAKFVNKINVGKLSNNKYEQVKVSFVKIEQDNKNDLKALHNIAEQWKNYKYALYIYKRTYSGLADNVFALTSQSADFERLNPDNILGVAEITDMKDAGHFLDYLQVKSDFVCNENPQFKGIGTAILNSLKKMFSKISLVATNGEYAKRFYTRNKFIEYPEDSCFFVWHKDVFENFCDIMY